MKVPQFWYNYPKNQSVLSTILGPLGSVYAAATALRVARSDVMTANCPIICVGNLNVGGTGKTPTVIRLAEMAKSMSAKPVILSRGYGGSLKGPIKVNRIWHEADQVGDEPLLLASFATTIVSNNRANGVKAAEELCPDLIILDDGFQDPSIKKTKSLIVVDAEKGFGNGRCLPAGPLREPVERGLRRADAVLSIGDEQAQANFALQWGKRIPCPLIKAELKPLETGQNWSDGEYFAFAGIGHPDKFFKTLENLGANLVHREALSDHATPSVAFLKRIKTVANDKGVQLVTTEKDAVRLPKKFKKEILTLPVRLSLNNCKALEKFLMSAMH